MRLIRYDPWSLLRGIHNELNMLSWPDRDGPADADADSPRSLDHWVPAVDVHEEPDRYVITADVPGVAPKDIDITMEGNVLTLKGARHEKKNEEGKGYVNQERLHGTFYRRFTLPATADTGKIEARGEHGVLKITLPKQPELQPRRIEVEH